MEPNGVPSAVPPAPSAGDLILQQKTEALQSAQKSDGTLLSQLTSNPLFTAVCNLTLTFLFQLAC
jgi:chaperone BCS1